MPADRADSLGELFANAERSGLPPFRQADVMAADILGLDQGN